MKVFWLAAAVTFMFAVSLGTWHYIVWRPLFCRGHCIMFTGFVTLVPGIILPFDQETYGALAGAAGAIVLGWLLARWYHRWGKRFKAAVARGHKAAIIKARMQARLKALQPQPVPTGG